MKSLNFYLLICLFAISTSCSDAPKDDNKVEIQDVKADNLVFETNQIEVFINEAWYGGNTELVFVAWKSALGSDFPEKDSWSPVAIVKSQPDSEGQTAHFLIAASTDGTVELGSMLVNENGVYKLGKGITYTCAGCKEGCGLRFVGTTASCSPCEGGSDCTKHEVAKVSTELG